MREPDYEAIERKVESDMVRSELEPTPGRWYVDVLEAKYIAIHGRCCLFSPQLLGKPVDLHGLYHQVIAKQLGVDPEWVARAMDGFDQRGFDGPGYAFGAEMRRKYVTDPAAAQEAADARRDREEDR